MGGFVSGQLLFWGPLGCFNDWAEVREVHSFLFLFTFLGGFDPQTDLSNLQSVVCEVEEVEVERLKVVAAVKLLTLLRFWLAATVAN